MIYVKVLRSALNIDIKGCMVKIFCCIEWPQNYSFYTIITLARVGGGYSTLFVCVCVCVTTKLVFKLNYLKI